MTQLRPELAEPPPPARIRGLPVSSRGYPVPWFVEWVTDGKPMPIGEGEPRFEIMSRDRLAAAIKQQRCWVCGGKLGNWRAFVIGPMCAVNRTSAEPPSHCDCAEWSARNCPFLSRPRMARRKTIIEGAQKAPGVALMRNPGVALVWTTRPGRYYIQRVPGGVLFKIGEPLSVAAWCQGREATADEVNESIESGMPSLRALAEDEGPLAVRELEDLLVRARALLAA